jgi:hypothetical protein
MRSLWKTVAIGLVLAFSSGLAAVTQNSVVPHRSTLDLRCLSPERGPGCGCLLKIATLSCSASHATGWKAHFFSELDEGTPLRMNLGGREFSVRSQVPRKNVFRHGRGDSWRETYENDDLKIRIQYRPGKSTCPAENDPDGCEYFDVAADVTVTITGAASHTYRTVGSCGC